MRYDHPREWFEYCRVCGEMALMPYPDTLRWEPIGEEWNSRGWHRYSGEGRVWWIKNALYDAVFLRDAPTCYQLYRGNKINVERVVDWCLLCHDTIGKMDDTSGLGIHDLLRMHGDPRLVG